MASPGTNVDMKMPPQEDVDAAKAYFAVLPDNRVQDDFAVRFKHFSVLNACSKRPTKNELYCLLCNQKRPIGSHIMPRSLLEAFGIESGVLVNPNTNALLQRAYFQSNTEPCFTRPLFCEDCDGKNWIGFLDGKAAELLSPLAKGSPVHLTADKATTLHYFGQTLALRYLIVWAMLHLDSEAAYLDHAVRLATDIHRTHSSQPRVVYSSGAQLLCYVTTEKYWLGRHYTKIFPLAAIDGTILGHAVFIQLSNLFLTWYFGEPRALIERNWKGCYSISNLALLSECPMKTGESCLDINPCYGLPSGLEFWRSEVQLPESYQPAQQKKILKELKIRAAKSNVDATNCSFDPDSIEWSAHSVKYPLFAHRNNFMVHDPEIQLLSYFQRYENKNTKQGKVLIQEWIPQQCKFDHYDYDWDQSDIMMILPNRGGNHWLLDELTMKHLLKTLKPAGVCLMAANGSITSYFGLETVDPVSWTEKRIEQAPPQVLQSPYWWLRQRISLSKLMLCRSCEASGWMAAFSMLDVMESKHCKPVCSKQEDSNELTGNTAC